MAEVQIQERLSAFPFFDSLLVSRSEAALGEVF
jgi:hypothetical protein